MPLGFLDGLIDDIIESLIVFLNKKHLRGGVNVSGLIRTQSLDWDTIEIVLVFAERM